MKETTTTTNGVEQMESLIKDSRDNLRSRNLKKALVTAQIALDFARQSNLMEDILLASLLLARIYSTNGRYLGDVSFFIKAEGILEQIEKAAKEKSPDFAIKWMRTKSIVLKDMGAYESALGLLEEAFESAQDTGADKILAKVLCTQSQIALLMGNSLKAYKYATRALEQYMDLPEEERDQYLQLEIFHQLSQVFVKKHDYSKALKYSQGVLRLSKEIGDAEKEVSALNAIAVISGVKSNYKIAMQYFQEALDKSEAIGYRDNIAHSLINIGTIYAHLYNYEDALGRYEKVLQKYKSVLDEQTKVVIFNNVGNIHYITGNFEAAQKFFTNALKLAKTNNLKEETALAMAQLARTFTALNDWNQAELLANKAAKLIGSLGLVNGCQINLINLADIHFQKKEYKRAKKLAEEGVAAARELYDDASEIRAYQLLSQILRKAGNYKKALEYHITLTDMKEEFSRVQRSRQFLDLEIKNALKEKQKEIEQLTKENELQALLLEKSDQIERQNEELIQINEDLRQFAYVASHDLKEPLRMIGSYAQIIQKMYAGKLDENGKTYFGYITEGVGRMNKLLDALLKYATVGKSELELETVDLNVVIDICKINLQVLIQESGAVIKTGKLPTIVTGKSLMTQLLQNLLSNAIRFRKPDVPCVIHIRVKNKTSEYEISVADNGIGIDPENQDRIFVIFQRLHSREAYKGTGIGLAICMKIVQRLGGNIRVNSKIGEGATFIVTLPKQSL